jgi:signal transduction histidine kinase
MKQDILFNKLVSYVEIDEFISKTIKEIVKSVDYVDAGIFYLYHSDTHLLSLEATYGYKVKNITHNLGVGEGLPGKCIEKGISLWLSSRTAIDKASGTMRKKNLRLYSQIHKGMPDMESVIAVPLKFNTKLVGVILLEKYYGNTSTFKKQDINQLENIGDYISLMVEYLRLNRDLKDSKRSYRDMFGKFLASNEAERKTIAREIHDEINHILLSVRLNLEDLENSISMGVMPAKEKISILYTHVNQAYEDLHRLSFKLRPPGLDDLGLPQALDWYVSILAQESGLPIKLVTGGLPYRKSAPVVETALLRIAQEALSNSLKHARADSVLVTLNYTRQNIVLDVEDNGIGFDLNSIWKSPSNTRNLGLLGMKERAEMCGGQLSITSSPGSGTHVRTVIPIDSYDWGIY